MVYKTYKLFLKIVTSLELMVMSILFVSIIFLYSDSAFSEVTNIERNLAYNYCDSIEQNLFKGLDNEKILKKEYLLNSINREKINEKLRELKNFSREVENICSYKLSIKEEENIKEMLERFFSNK